MKRRFFAGLTFFAIVGVVALVLLTVADDIPTGFAGLFAAG